MNKNGKNDELPTFKNLLIQFISSLKLVFTLGLLFTILNLGLAQPPVAYIGNVETRSGAGPSTVPYTVSNGSARMLIAVYTGGGNGDVGGLTAFNGMTFTSLKTATSTCCPVAMDISVWTLPLGSGAAISDMLTLNINTSGGTDTRLHVFEIHNVDQMAPVGDMSMGGASSLSVMADVDDMIISFFVQRSPSGNPTLTPSSMQTAIFNIAGNSSQDQYAGAYFPVTATGSISDNWTTSGSFPNPIHLVMEFNQAIPGIMCPPDASIACETISPDPTVTGEAIGIDACAGEDTVFSDVVTPLSILRTWSIPTCAEMPSCVQTITRIYTSAPTITCPPNITVDCIVDVSMLANTGGSATASDGCDLNPVITFSDSDPGGTCRVITRIWTATNAGMLSADCQQMITVVDNENPVIMCPADVTIACSDDRTTVANGMATATDNCGSPVITYVDSNPSATCGVISRIWTATDACGNAVMCTQSITVMDNIAPIITCPADLTLDWIVGLDTTPTATGTGIATATDNCNMTPSISVSQMIAPGICAGDFIITRTFIASDTCGNQDMCTQIIVVQDTTRPVISGPADLTLDWIVGLDTTATLTGTGSATAVDDCDQNPIISYSQVVAPGSCEGDFLLTRVWTAMDACTNASSTVQVITVQDTTRPVLSTPADTTINCAPLLDTMPSMVGMATAIDDCDPNPTITYADVLIEGICPGTDTIDRTWTVIDACMNMNTSVQRIIIQDTTPPVISCPTQAILDCSLVDPIDPTVTGRALAMDECGVESIFFTDDVVLNCLSATVINRTWSAVDSCGNVTSCTQVIDPVEGTLTKHYTLNGKLTNGNLNVGLIYTLKNTGIVDIDSIVVTDEIDNQLGISFIGFIDTLASSEFPPGYTPVVSNRPSLDTMIALEGAILLVGDSIRFQVNIEINVDLIGIDDTLKNQAVARVISLVPDPLNMGSFVSIVGTDLSDAGLAPSTINPGAPGDMGTSNDSLCIILPNIHHEKMLDSIETDCNLVMAEGGDPGDAIIWISYKVKNNGQLILDSLLVLDSLQSQLGSTYDSLLAVIGSPYSNGDTLFYQPGVPFAPNDSFTFQISLLINPNSIGAPMPLKNQSIASAWVFEADNPNTAVFSSGESLICEPSDDPITSILNDPTCLFIPNLGMAKWIDTSYLVPTPSDSVGNFFVRYKIKLKNTGNTDLDSVKLIENLISLGSAYMGPPAFPLDQPMLSITHPIVNSPNLNLNYDGITDTLIFTDPDVRIPKGDSIIVCLQIMVNPNATGASSTLFNQAWAMGLDTVSGYVAMSATDEGMDAEGLNGNTSCTDSTLLELVDINISKQILSVRPYNQDSFPGDALVEFQLLIKNKGNLPIYDIMVNDPIQAQLGTTFLEVINDPALISPPEIINGAIVSVPPATVSPTAMPFPKVIDGSIEDDTLNRDEFIDIRYSLRLDANNVAFPDYRTLSNQADAMGSSLLGITADSSDTGPDPESSNPGELGDTGSEEDATHVAIPMIGLATEITKVRAAQSGTEGNFDAIFHVYIKNTGNSPLDNILLFEDLATQYGVNFVEPVSLQYLATVPGAPPINAVWTGVAPNHSLTSATPSTQFLPGESLLIEMIVEINPIANGALCDSLYNVVVAEARGVEFDGTPLKDAFNMLIITYDTSDAGIDPEGFNPENFADRGLANDSTIIPDCWKTACNPSLADIINLSMNENCEAELTPDLFVNGVSAACLDLCFWQITKIVDQYGRDVPNPVTKEYVGQTLTVTLQNIVCENPGWSQVKLEDKFASNLTCEDRFLNCWEAEEFLAATPETDACGYDLQFEEVHRTWVDFECEDPNYIGFIQRSIISQDVWGNTNRCDSQRIYIIRENLENLVCPDSPVEIECCSLAIDPATGNSTYVLWNPHYVYEDSEGYSHPIPKKGGLVEPPYVPSINGPHYIGSITNSKGGVNSGKCNIIGEYKDHIIPTCGSSYKIRREWKIYDWCENVDTFCVQWIKIIDTTGPILDAELKLICLDGSNDCNERVEAYNLTKYDECHQPRTVYVQPHECLAYVDILYPEITKECGLIAAKGDEAKIADALSKITVSYIIKYQDASHPGKEIVIHNEIGTDGDIIYLPYGWYQVVYYITDGCWNTTYACEYIVVEDNVAPTPVCDEITQVTLDPDSCWVRIYAHDLDDGSNDNCVQNLHYAVAQMDSIEFYQAYWNQKLFECYGEYNYNHYRYYIDELIENWINCFVFNDYVDVSECGQETLVMRVYEADGLPIYDDHIFAGSKHQWFCFNLYDDYACFFKYHYEEFSNYENPKSDLCDYIFQSDETVLEALSSCAQSGSLKMAYHKLLYDPNCQCFENADGITLNDCQSCDQLQIRFSVGIANTLGEGRIGLGSRFLHGPSVNRSCCVYESTEATEAQALHWWNLANKYPIINHLDCKRYQFKHLYSDCMIEVIKDDKTPPVCIPPSNAEYYCDGVPVYGSLFPNGGNDKINWTSAQFAHDICKYSDYFLVGCEFDRTDDGANNYDAPDDSPKEGWCIDAPWDGGVHGYYGGPVDDSYSYDDPCDENLSAWLPEFSYTWKPIYCRFWLMLDKYDLEGDGKPDAYSYFGEPEIYDNCWYPDVVEETAGKLDECGVGYLTRTWTVTDKCGNTASCHQTITIRPRSDFEVKFPADIEVTCDALENLSPIENDPATYPIVTDDDCELIGISYSDQVIDTKQDGCYKILRTWKVIDWCLYSPELHNRYADVIVDDRCVADSKHRPCVIRNLKDDGDGFVTYLQVLRIVDDVAPIVSCNSVFVACIFDEECDYLFVEYDLGSAIDNCTDELQYRYTIIPNGDSDESEWVFGHGTSVQNTLPIGVHTAILYAKDDCGNEDSCMLTIEVRDCKPPTPYCYDGIATVVMPSTEEITVWARDLDAGSFDNCTLQENLRFTFTSTPPDEDSTYVEDDKTSSNTYTCDDLGQVPVDIYVWDETGNVDFCKVVLLIQPGSEACPGQQLSSSMDDSKTSIGIQLGEKVETKSIIRFRSYDSSNIKSLPPQLYQNRPNPFTSRTIIGFELPKSQHTLIQIMDMNGRVVKKYQGSYTKGYNELEVIGLNGKGVYYYQLKTEKLIMTKKMILID